MKASALLRIMPHQVLTAFKVFSKKDFDYACHFLISQCWCYYRSIIAVSWLREEMWNVKLILPWHNPLQQCGEHRITWTTRIRTNHWLNQHTSPCVKIMTSRRKLHAPDRFGCKETVFWAIYMSHYISNIANSSAIANNK